MNKIVIPKGIQKAAGVRERASLQDGGKVLYYKGEYHIVNRVAREGVYVEIVGEQKDEFGETMLEGYNHRLFQWEEIA